MPAPPRKGEARQAFISRCISHMRSKEGRDVKQAAAICFDMWRRKDRVARKAAAKKRT